MTANKEVNPAWLAVPWGADVLAFFLIGEPIYEISVGGVVVGLVLQTPAFLLFLSFSLLFFRNFGLESAKGHALGMLFGGLILMLSSDVLYRSVYYGDFPAVSKTRGDKLPPIRTRVR